jgi:hypothetical protein
MYGYVQWLDRPVNENVIDSQHRKSRRECANGLGRSNEFAHIAQMPVKCSIGSRTAETVEVAEQNKRRVTGDCCAPLGAGKQLCLNEAFAPAETEMCVNDVDLPEIGFNIHFNGGAILAAEKRWSAW